MEKTYTVFTYGSLMKGFYGYDNFMQEAEFLGTASVKGDLRFFCSDYPVMIKKNKGGKPGKGELYRVNEKTMRELRKYEGIGNPFTCYTEKVVQAQTENGNVRARAFVVSPSIEIPMMFTTRHIPSADWRKFSESGRKLPIPQPLIILLGIGLAAAAIWELHYFGLINL